MKFSIRDYFIKCDQFRRKLLAKQIKHFINFLYFLFHAFIIEIPHIKSIINRHKLDFSENLKVLHRLLIKFFSHKEFLMDT